MWSLLCLEERAGPPDLKKRRLKQTRCPLGEERAPIASDGPRPLRAILPVQRSLRPIKAVLLRNKNLMTKRDSYHPEMAFLQHDTAIVLRLGAERGECSGTGSGDGQFGSSRLIIGYFMSGRHAALLWDPQKRQTDS